MASTLHEVASVKDKHRMGDAKLKRHGSFDQLMLARAVVAASH